MSDWAGTDFALGDDLYVSNQGDYALVSEEKNVDIAVKRRITTPLGSLFYDETYGNPVYDILGENMDDTWVIQAKEGLISCLEYEERIELMSVDVVTLNEERTARFFVAYGYRKDDEMETNTLQGVISDVGISVSG